jgi:hypothetical protein
LRNPEPFDPLKLSRYTVFRVWYEYPGQRAEEKLYIALRHEKQESGRIVCRCIKTTCRTEPYEADAERMKGAILYEANVLRFFYTKTIIDPYRNFFEMPHAHLLKEANNGRYRIEGKMPEDFRGKLIRAIEQSITLEPKNKTLLLSYLEEPKKAT